MLAVGVKDGAIELAIAIGVVVKVLHVAVALDAQPATVAGTLYRDVQNQLGERSCQKKTRGKNNLLLFSF